ncbi:hypothetical protein Q5692_33160 [Microcoleus sp. C2C3]|uniref:hypothetical protein n=1 Tax=unclassified Microcoleus TaxID=2642155 RepID=UPI002FD4FD57
MRIDLATHNKCVAFIRKAFTADREFARLRCSNLERTYTIARKPHTARGWPPYPQIYSKKFELLPSVLQLLLKKCYYLCPIG